MSRSAAIALGTALAGAALVRITYDTHASVIMFAVLAAVGASALAAAHIAAGHRRRLGRLGRQFAFAVAIAIGAILAAVGLAVARMFVSHHDALMISVIVTVSGAVAVRAAQLLAQGVLTDIEAVRDGLVAVGAGERQARIATASCDELAQLAEAANAMIERLAAEEHHRDAADRARRDLVVAVSHDLRTPLSSLRLLTEAIQDGVVDGQTRTRYLAEMRMHVAALSALIDDLFELSRLEAGDIEWSMQQVQLGELVGETVAAMRAEAQAQRVAVIAELPAGLAPARANPEQLQRVLFNLIQNAIRHTPQDGSVTVRAATTTDGIEIEVADTGDGVAPDDRPRIFEPFYRGGAQASRNREGAGLGLAISRAIVEAHGGRIWLADTPLGTRVRFSLPATLLHNGRGKNGC